MDTIASERPTEVSDLLKKAASSLARIDAATLAAEQGLGDLTAIVGSVRRGEGEARANSSAMRRPIRTWSIYPAGRALPDRIPRRDLTALKQPGRSRSILITALILHRDTRLLRVRRPASQPCDWHGRTIRGSTPPGNLDAARLKHGSTRLAGGVIRYLGPHPRL